VQSVFVLWITLTHVQDSALSLVEPHEVYMCPLLELVQVPLDGIPSLRHYATSLQTFQVRMDVALSNLI